MYVRLGFSVAVNVDPEILIIDEVIAVGDEQFQRRCFDHLYSLRQQGVTIVMVTHNMGLVQTMCDNAAWLEPRPCSRLARRPDPRWRRPTSTSVNAAEAASREAAVDAADEAEQRADRRTAPPP